MPLLIVFLLALDTAQARVHQLSATELEGRITNGNNALSGESPFQVFLFLQNSYVCGGSILDEQHFLTAAHCTEGITFGLAIFGNTDISKASVIREFGQEDIIIHPGWNYSEATNDISIIRVRKFSFSTSIQPVRLATTNSDLAGDKVTATGWGRTDDFSALTHILQTVDLELINNTRCKSYYGAVITDGMICTSTDGGKSTCNGDSGGPLVRKSSQEQVGIVSFGSVIGCTLGYPAVFTRVANFVPWIESVLFK